MPAILCIDDDPMVLELQKSLFETQGYTVLTASDGPTGIALACTNCLDAVVLDFRMPGMDGDQVAEVLIKEYPNLPVVVCSGFPHEVPEWLKWFAAAFWEKGNSPSALLSAIRKLIVKNELYGQVEEIHRRSRHVA
jgi:CheY-like chemotaxis protein